MNDGRERAPRRPSSTPPSRRTLKGQTDLEVLDFGPAQSSRSDLVIVEAPLEIRLAGDLLATTMRTPGQDHELALGFLHSEGLIVDSADVSRVFHCGRPEDRNYGNVVEVTPGPGAVIDPEALARSRRTSLVSSACGLCGYQGLLELETRLERLYPNRNRPSEDATDETMPALRGTEAEIALAEADTQTLKAALPELRAAQPLFEWTGASHAAGLVQDARLTQVSEDVGRHNAVDKIVGRLLIDGTLRTQSVRDQASPRRLLLLSGRVSFELLQKAALAGFDAVGGVSAPTSLSVRCARRLGIGLYGFLRGERATAYALPRVDGGQSHHE